MLGFQPERAAPRFRRRIGKTKAAKPTDHRLVFTRLLRLRLLGVSRLARVWPVRSAFGAALPEQVSPS
jgi:hypothetical protein